MPGTILVRECLRRASKLLGDISPQFQRHPEQELVDYLNDAAMAVVKFLPSSASRIDTIKLKPGTRQSIESIAALDCKPGDGSVPSAAILGISVLGGAMRNMGSDALTAGRVIRIVDRKMLDAQDPDWHLATRASTVVRSIMFDPLTPRYFYVTPPVHASTSVWIELPYNAQPIKVPNTGAPGTELYLSEGASTLVIPTADEYIDDLVNYVVARANMKETEWADTNKATYFASLFLASLNGKVAALTGSSPNLKRLPYAPEPLGQAG